MICTGCGLDQRTGERISTARRPAGAGLSRLDGLWEWVLHPLVVAAWGAAAIIGLSLGVGADADLAGFFAFGTVLAWLGCGVYILYRGWQESGVIGVLFAYRFPLGGLVEDPSGRRLTAFWLLGVAGVCAVLLVMKHPEIVQSLPIGRPRPTRAAHDVFLAPN